jgi:hypothetical protein
MPIEGRPGLREHGLMGVHVQAAPDHARSERVPDGVDAVDSARVQERRDVRRYVAQPLPRIDLLLGIRLSEPTQVGG